jgi:hypothetical protein
MRRTKLFLNREVDKAGGKINAACEQGNSGRSEGDEATPANGDAPP